MSASPGGTVTPVDEGPEAGPSAKAPAAARRSLGLDRFAILFVFALLVIGFGIARPSTFLSTGNLDNILGQQAVLFILVMAVLLPTLMGDFVDLSLGASAGLSAMTLAVLNDKHGVPVVLACLGALGAALAVGLINVYFVVYFDNDPFIVTLGTMTVVQGIIYIISGSNSVGTVSVSLSNWIFNNTFLSIPLEFYYGLAIFLVVWYVLSFTPGRINPVGALVAVYFLATGTAGLELLGTQSYIQQIFYGAALVAAITIPKVTRRRIFKRKQLAA